MQPSPDGSYVVTASLDKTAKLIDVVTLEVLKTYKTGRFVQSAAISPVMDHVLLGGGQDASQVGAWGGAGGRAGAVWQVYGWVCRGSWVKEDVISPEVLMTYKKGRFVQSAVITPLMDHVLLGGGWDASQVGAGKGRGLGTLVAVGAVGCVHRCVHVCLHA